MNTEKVENELNFKEENLQKENKYLREVIENSRKDHEFNFNMWNKKIDSLNDTIEINSKLFQLKIELKEREFLLEKEKYQKILEMKQKTEDYQMQEKLKENEKNLKNKDRTIDELTYETHHLTDQINHLKMKLQQKDDDLRMSIKRNECSIHDFAYKEDDLLNQINKFKIQENQADDEIKYLHQLNQNKDEEIYNMKEMIKKLNLSIQSLQNSKEEKEKDIGILKGEIEGMKYYKNEMKEVYEKMIQEYQKDLKNNLEIFKIYESKEKK